MVIGGVAIFGGSGTVWGAAIGAILLVTINRALPILGIPDFWQRAVVGALILGAIVLDRVLAARQARQARRSEGRIMTRHHRDPTTPGRTYAAYARPLWQRLLLTRESAVIALLVAVLAYATSTCRLRRPADHLLPAARHRPDPADRAADDAGDHHRRDRPLGRERGRPEQRAASAILHQDGLSDPGGRAGRPRSSALVCGAFNGFLVAYVGLPSLAVTIGTLALYRGLAVGLLGTKAVTDFPEQWTDLAKQQHRRHAAIPVIVIPFVVLRSLFALLLHFSSFGRGVYDIGLNAEAAHFTGVNVARTKFILFVLVRRRVGASPASTSRCATAAPAATTPPASSSR